MRTQHKTNRPEQDQDHFGKETFLIGKEQAIDAEDFRNIFPKDFAAEVRFLASGCNRDTTHRP